MLQALAAWPSGGGSPVSILSLGSLLGTAERGPSPWRLPRVQSLGLGGSAAARGRGLVCEGLGATGGAAAGH